MSGVFQAEQSTRLSILNGSHHANGHDEDMQSVLILPDYLLVNVPSGRAGVQKLWIDFVRAPSRVLPSFTAEHPPLKAWVLPYACVILLCSHKKRDNRCAIAAPKLVSALETALHQEGWEVHRELDDVEMMGPPLASASESSDARRKGQESSQKRALILMNSHMGGHKFAGNMMIYTPTEAGIWYGRVTTHHVEHIVRETIIGGQVFPELLRGGVNLGRRGSKSLLDW